MISPTSTDAIIEELKLLAKSMLDTSISNAQRRSEERARLPSFEEIIASLNLPPHLHPTKHTDPHVPHSTEAKDHRGVLPSRATQPQPQESGTVAATTASEGCADALFAADDGEGQRLSRVSTSASVEPKICETVENTKFDELKQPAPLAEKRTANLGRGRIGDDAVVKSSSSLRWDSDAESSDDDGPRLHVHQGVAPAVGRHRRDDGDRRDRSESQSAESDAGICDYVKTQVLFRQTDRVAYDNVCNSTWAPERIIRRNGVVVTDDDVESDDDTVKEDDSKSGDGQTGEVVRLFRVPSFPFGGGITETQLRELCVMFYDTLQSDSFHGDHAVAPQIISKKAFESYAYEECATTEAQRASFQPCSPYEFVVEIERSIVFDAVSAREKRRREFSELAKKNKAPVTMGTFNLRVIMDPLKTGFEEEKEFPIVRGTIVADRYQIIELLGKATFSRAVRCYDLHQPIFDNDDDDNDGAASGVEDHDNGSCSTGAANGGSDGDGADSGSALARRDMQRPKAAKKPIGYVEVCLKIINNTKEFFDQSLDEIRLLTLINKYRDPDEVHVVRLIDSFYYKEHTMLVTELLSDNLYEYSKYNREEEDALYFTLPRLRSIAQQILEALSYVHGMSLIHADLKPENILFVSHRRCLIKVIDFGSSCFLSDHLSSYIQSRSYRAPEVILGCDYDGRIDVWSLGAILVELVTGDVLFTSETVPEMLARIVAVCGMPFPRHMLWEGRHTSNFINKFGCIYEAGSRGGDNEDNDDDSFYLFSPVSGATSNATSDRRRERSLKASEKEFDVSDSCDAQYAKTGSALQKNIFAEPYTLLKQKLAAHDVCDEEFLDFVQQCLTLDHHKRPTSAQLLEHPFIALRK